MSTSAYFMIGPFCEGMSLFPKIKNFITHMESGSLTASAFRLKLGYPVLIKKGADIIKGTIAHCDTSEILNNIINELLGFNPQDMQGSLYQREIVEVQTERGFVSCYAYFLNESKLPSNAKYINSGDWQKEISNHPPIPNILNERQKNYIQKLGQSSGRDIVPIDLSLYRELMKLELVIDKGRRIALTKLGQEVYRYL